MESLYALKYRTMHFYSLFGAFIFLWNFHLSHGNKMRAGGFTELGPHKADGGPETHLDWDLVYQVNLTAANRFLAEDVTKFVCGTKQICGETENIGPPVCTMDCDPCQCDDMCHFYGDCCPDLLFKDSPDIPSTPSPYVSCSEDYLPRLRWNTFSYIYLVSSCPINVSPATSRKCENPDKGDREQVTAVSSPTSQITYRNIFCAQCHGVTDVEAWRYRVTCNTSRELRAAKTKVELWSVVTNDLSCAFRTISPDSISPRRCFRAQVDGCIGETGVVQSDLRYLCELFSNTVDYTKAGFPRKKYRNIFCAVCNGAELDKNTSCFEQGEAGSDKAGSPFPGPLSVLLDFNLSADEELDASEHGGQCGVHEAYDPFLMSCLEISCSERRILVNGVCEEAVSPLNVMGFSMQTILRPANPSDRIPFGNILDQYLDMLKANHSWLILSMEINLFTSDLNATVGVSTSEMATVQGKLVSKSNRSMEKEENDLLSVLRQTFAYNYQGGTVLLESNPHLCLLPYDVPPTYRNVLEQSVRSLEPIPDCEDCADDISFEPIRLHCPFIEYLNNSNFTFSPTTYTIAFGEYSFPLNQDEFRSCGNVLRICVETIANISEVILGVGAQRGLVESKEAPDKILSIVSLVCISLSLGGLALTFLLYSVLPKLRTLPGKNSMALMFHLFWAQLFFLTTSNRTANAVLCRVFGVVIHYFWMASFTWMLMSAYHMYTVFTSIRAYTGDCSTDTKRLAVYSVIGVVVPVLIIASCVTTHLVQHQGVDIGYGGDICFLNNPTAIGVFFVAPLSLMLLLNAVFFTRTILAIRSVPDMKEASNKSRKHHVFVYIKLSLLFGFTWIFGIVGAIFQSVVFSYTFNVLTGSQGVMIFVAYCVNRRIWTLLKDAISTDNKLMTGSTAQTKNVYITESTEAKDESPP